jgi:hypothetical protein
MSDIRRTEDAALIRYLDGEPLSGDPAVPATAGSSSDRLWELREASAAFSALLTHLPAPQAPPPRLARPRPARRGLRAAVVALLAFAGAAAAMPTTRSRILEALEAVISRESPTATAAPDVGGTTVTFVPISEAFTIEVRSIQSDGVLVVQRASLPGVTAESSGPTDLLVLPSGLVVANPPTSTADVWVRLPEAVSELRITVAGVPIEVGPVEPGAPLRIPLTGRGR